jgi:hypothetical protein
MLSRSVNLLVTRPDKNPCDVRRENWPLATSLQAEAADMPARRAADHHAPRRWAVRSDGGCRGI